MQNSILEVKAALQIQKPIREVFEAIVDPAKMTNYFISKSTGRMEEGKHLIWNFPEFETDFLIRVGTVIQDKFISFYWLIDNKELITEMILTPREADTTLVNITEKSMENDDAGIKWLQGNTEGWANFLACLKAYLEHGINLRKGGYEFLKQGK